MLDESKECLINKIEGEKHYDDEIINEFIQGNNNKKNKLKIDKKLFIFYNNAKMILQKYEFREKLGVGAYGMVMKAKRIDTGKIYF